MSKVITFSKVFPAYHPKKGQPTCFVEKIWMGFIRAELISLSRCCELSRETGIGGFNMNNIRKFEEEKHHTIRAGNRWKVGDKFSPRVWSGKPYQSKQIIIAPDIEIRKTWAFYMDEHGFYYVDGDTRGFDIEDVCKNDGLTKPDFDHWFCAKKGKPFTGQIICWNENIKY